MRLVGCLALLGLLVGGVLVPDDAAAQDAPRASTASPPNMLVFVADDAGWRDFGAYGNDVIRTPNVDRLSETGLTFERAFLTTPQCSPSRISMLTGKYPHSTGAEDLHMPLPEHEVLLPTYLRREAGYLTGIMRKRHLGEPGNEQFDWYDPAEEHDYGAFGTFLDRAQANEQPFFMWVGFSDPHRPYEEGTLDRPHDPARVSVPPYLADTPSTRADLADYYDEIARMDQNIGRMLRMLEDRGLRANTLVVFLSDNGMPFPRAKGTLYDAGIRTPLIVNWPGQVDPGTYDGLTSVIDLAPTLLDVAGLSAPDDMQGRSIAAVLDDRSLPGRDFVFSERNWHDTDAHMRSLRTDEYKLITNGYPHRAFPIAADIGDSPAWFSLLEKKRAGTLTEAQARLFETPRPAVEVYHLPDDEWELRNVAGTPEHDATIDSLTQRLHRWTQETGDFPPTRRTRADHTDRSTGVWYRHEIPPMRNDGGR
jgi:arylsulfatase A-like enzyme